MTQTRKRGAPVSRRCPCCRGETVVERPVQEPPRTFFLFEEAPWPGRESVLEQGQMVAPTLVEIVECSTCAGRGKVKVTLNPAEYRALRRRRIVRGLILLIAGSIPFLFLLGSILAQPDLLCGRPWYGVGFLLLLLVARS